MNTIRKASKQPDSNIEQIAKVKEIIQRHEFVNPLLVNLADYLIYPHKEQPFYSSELNASLIESCYIGPSKLLLYNFERGFAKCLSNKRNGKSQFDEMFDALRLCRVQHIEQEFYDGAEEVTEYQYRKKVIAGSCTTLEFRDNYLFITTGEFMLTKAKGSYRVLRQKGTKVSYLYNGTSLYVRGSAGQKLWDRPLDEIADSIKQNIHFPFLANILVCCLNHALGPDAHFLRAIVTYSSNTWEEVMALLNVPFRQSALKKHRTKLDLLKRTGGIVSKFSGKLPFSQALVFVLATKQVKREHYDYLLNSYRASKVMQQASTHYDLLKTYYMLKYGVPISNLKKAFFVGQHPSHKMQLIIDYLSICRKLKQQVDLSITTLKRMDEIHVGLALKLKINQLCVHEDFDLENADELELIKTPYRLIDEGINQRHCVASYANSINSGFSGIYSTVYQGKRYTVELMRVSVFYGKNNEKVRLSIRQIRGFANKGAPVSLHKHIETILNQQKDRLASDDDIPF